MVRLLFALGCLVTIASVATAGNVDLSIEPLPELEADSIEILQVNLEVDCPAVAPAGDIVIDVWVTSSAPRLGQSLYFGDPLSMTWPASTCATSSRLEGQAAFTMGVPRYAGAGNHAIEVYAEGAPGAAVVNGESYEGRAQMPAVVAPWANITITPLPTEGKGYSRLHPIEVTADGNTHIKIEFEPQEYRDLEVIRPDPVILDPLTDRGSAQMSVMVLRNGLPASELVTLSYTATDAITGATVDTGEVTMHSQAGSYAAAAEPLMLVAVAVLASVGYVVWRRRKKTE